eukprot:UN05495
MQLVFQNQLMLMMLMSILLSTNILIYDVNISINSNIFGISICIINHVINGTKSSAPNDKNINGLSLIIVLLLLLLLLFIVLLLLSKILLLLFSGFCLFSLFSLFCL